MQCVFTLCFLSLQLILTERGWFRNKATILHEGEGNIRTIKWRSCLIAWANDAVRQNMKKAYLPVIWAIGYLNWLIVCLCLSGSQGVWHKFSTSNNSHKKRARKVCTNIWLAIIVIIYFMERGDMKIIFILPLSTQE